MNPALAMVIVGVLAAVVGLLAGLFVFKRNQPETAGLDEQLRQMEERLRERFKAAAAEALQGNQELLLSQARQTMEGAQKLSASEWQKQNLEFQKTVTPLQNSLQKIEGELRALEQTRTVAYTSLGEQIKELSLAQKELRAQAGALVGALRDPKTRGSWGELQLKRVVEFAGMVNYVDFKEQVHSSTDDGNKQPDMIIKLPNNRVIVVDAKVPLKDYIEAVHAESPEEKKRLLLGHAEQLRKHFKALGSKKYFEEFESPEFVVLFLNLESSLSAALEQAPQLIEEALQSRVIIATPTTLIALLKTVSYGWGEAKAAEKAREIVSLGRELMERFMVVSGYWQKAGDSLGKAVEAYNQAANSTQSRLMVTARKLDETREITEPAVIQARPVNTLSNS